MNPKEKAKELFDKMYFYQSSNAKLNTPTLVIELAKECALIAVKESSNTCVESMIYYWMKVKIEIEKL